MLNIQKILGNGLATYHQESFDLTLTYKDSYGATKTSNVMYFSNLKGWFSDRLILTMIDYLLSRLESGLSGVTVYSEGYQLVNLLTKAVTSGIIDKKEGMDELTPIFLYSLCTIEVKIRGKELSNLCTIFNSGFPHIFSSNVNKSDIPRKEDKKGLLGRSLHNIMQLALSRQSLAGIIIALEDAYENKKLSLGSWAFFNLSLNTRVRIGSIRMITLGDIVHDEAKDEYFAYILPEKQNVDLPQKSPFKLSRGVGKLLRKQRLVILKSPCAKLVPIEDSHKLALFPAKTSDKTGLWIAADNFGMYKETSSFASAYQSPINKLLGDRTINTQVFRHSVGSHMASIGMSAKTIKAVLRHVGERTCQAYVELHFQGNIEKLSDALLPAFEKHFPVFKEFSSLHEQHAQEKLINSDNLNTGEVVVEGVCGADMRCLYAPFSCYSCRKFTPFYDADHEVNLRIIESRIEQFRSMGHAFNESIETLRRTKAFITLTVQACEVYKKELNEPV